MPERVVPRSKPVPPVSRARRHEPAASPPPETPPPGSPVPLPAGAQAAVGANVLGPPVERPPDATPPLPVEGGEAGAGKLFDKGDVGVVPGAGALGAAALAVPDWALGGRGEWRDTRRRFATRRRARRRQWGRPSAGRVSGQTPLPRVRKTTGC